MTHITDKEKSIKVSNSVDELTSFNLLTKQNSASSNDVSSDETETGQSDMDKDEISER